MKTRIGKKKKKHVPWQCCRWSEGKYDMLVMREREDSNEETRGFTVWEIENGFRVCAHRVSGSGRRLFSLWLGLFQGFQEDDLWTRSMWFKKKGFFEISIGRRWKGFFMNRSVWFERKTMMRDFHKNTTMIGVCCVVWVATNSIYLNI
jgi:hypothetical protein